MWPFRKKPNCSPAAPYDHNAEAEKFLNSAKDFPAQPHIIANYIDIATPEQPATPVGASMSFIGVLEAIGKDFEKGLVWAIKYAIPVEKLIGLIFPAALPATTEVVDATTLIQNAILLVEQKYAASGAQSGTGAQKSAEVLALTEQAVTSLLTKAGVTNATTDYIQSIISAVVALLNVQGFVAPVAPAAAA